MKTGIFVSVLFFCLLFLVNPGFSICDCELVLVPEQTSFSSDTAEKMDILNIISQKNFQQFKQKFGAGISIGNTPLSAFADFNSFNSARSEYFEKFQFSRDSNESVTYLNSVLSEVQVKAWANCQIECIKKSNNDGLYLLIEDVSEEYIWFIVVWNPPRGVTSQTIKSITLLNGKSLTKPFLITGDKLKSGFEKRYTIKRALSNGIVELSINTDSYSCRKVAYPIKPPVVIIPPTVDRKNKLYYKYETQMGKIWDDDQTGAEMSISFFKAHPSDGFQTIGYFYHQSERNIPVAPNNQVLVVKEATANNPPLLIHPNDFTFIWNDRHTGATYGNCSIWRPVCPNGYSPFSDVAYNSHTKPNTNVIYCVKDELLTTGVNRRLGYRYMRGFNFKKELKVFSVDPLDNVSGVSGHFWQAYCKGTTGFNLTPYKVLRSDSIINP